MAEKSKHLPIRQSVHVDCPIEDAFRLFTEGFGEWWPLRSYSAAGCEAAGCAIEPWAGGRVLESTQSGEEYEWGAVVVWDPPRHLTLSWHPRTSREHTPRNDDQRVDIHFQVEADGTRVTLIHVGWELAGVEACPARFSEFASAQMLAAV